MLQGRSKKVHGIRRLLRSGLVLIVCCMAVGASSNSETQDPRKHGSRSTNEKNPLWGALAIDSNQGQSWGWAIDYPTVQAAKQRALAECGQNCRVVMTFSNQCAAYAADQTRGSTIYGWAKDSTGTSARNRAMNECRNRGGESCIVRVWGCTRR